MESVLAKSSWSQGRAIKNIRDAVHGTAFAGSSSWRLGDSCREVFQRKLKAVGTCLQEFLPLGSFNELEAKNFEALKSELRGSIQKGVNFVNKSEPQLPLLRTR